jgi:hypothetical protein
MLVVLAILVIFNCGALADAVTVLVQWPAAGQLLSPPPLMLALFVMLLLLATPLTVTGMAKLVVEPAGKPLATVQVTVWLLTVQPVGSVPTVRLAGNASVIVATASVGAVPALVTCSV